MTPDPRYVHSKRKRRGRSSIRSTWPASGWRRCIPGPSTHGGASMR